MMWLSRKDARRIGGLYSIFAFLLLVILSGLPLQQAHSDVADGVAWLSSQQLSDGSYADTNDVANPTQSTSEALRTFYFLDETGLAGIGDAAAFLNAESYRNTENLSRLIIATAQSGGDVSPLVSTLFSHQNRDGGFGELAGYDSTIIDTAFALDALALSSQPKGDALISALYFLLNRQQADGGWYDGANQTTVFTTSLALNALRHFRDDIAGISDAMTGAKRFLLEQRNASGLWSEGFETASALIALVNSVNEYSEVEYLVNDFAGKQLINGSWDDSPYATALALRALSSRPVPAPEPVTTGSISGRVIDAQTRQAINGAEVTVEGSSLTGNSGPTGEFTVQELAPGSVTVYINMPGYFQRSYNATLVAGQVTGLGDVQMSLMPTTAAIQGLVTDDQTGLPLSGAVVNLSGSSSGTATTDAFGKYTLSNLQPGAFTITIAMSGYENVMANGSLTAGNSLVFSPSLKRFEITEQTDPNQPSTGTATIHGQVKDINSRHGLTGVTVAVTGSANAETLTTSAGFYSLSGLSLIHI